MMGIFFQAFGAPVPKPLDIETIIRYTEFVEANRIWGVFVSQAVSLHNPLVALKAPFLFGLTSRCSLRQRRQNKKGVFAMYNLTCKNCGNVFRDSHKIKLYCSNKCYREHYDFTSFHNATRRPAVDRFWEKVDKRGDNDCWEWKAYTISKVKGHEYGYFDFGSGKDGLAHRFSYTLHFGEIPDRMEVCHRCDNPKCVNPKHLFIGTHQDNMNDRTQKGRTGYLVGEDHPRSKLTNSKVIQIRKLSKKLSINDLAKKFCVSRGAITAILSGQTWKHLR